MYLTQDKQTFFDRFKPVLILLGILSIIAIIIIGFSSTQDKNEKKGVFTSNCTTEATPDPSTGGITWTLPDCASPVRLSLPWPVSTIFNNTATGIAGYGVVAGEHIEGLNHQWIALPQGTPIRSWADGVVRTVHLSGDVENGEIQVVVDYGHNLVGVHMELERSLVKEGQPIKAGEIVGYGWGDNKDSGPVRTASAEFALLDLGRDDGTIDHGPSASTVSLYDYLNDADKMALVAAYRKNVLEPYAEGKQVSGLFHPYQPYLTNELFLHKGNKGKLTGEWYRLTDRFQEGDSKDVITFIEADNPYFKGDLIFSRNNNVQGKEAYSGPNGLFEVDYPRKRFVVKNGIGGDPGKILPADAGNGSYVISYYGIFDIDESGPRAELKVKYQKDSYPDTFDDALEYIERGK